MISTQAGDGCQSVLMHPQGQDGAASPIMAHPPCVGLSTSLTYRTAFGATQPQGRVSDEFMESR